MRPSLFARPSLFHRKSRERKEARKRKLSRNAGDESSRIKFDDKVRINMMELEKMEYYI